MNNIHSQVKRGRPPKQRHETFDTKAELIRSGVEYLTKFGFTSSGIDAILKRVGVPKGSFYHYFANKEEFGKAVIEHYHAYFSHKLDEHLSNEAFSPLSRIENFSEDAIAGMTRYQFKRGCLIGNLGQEVDSLPGSFRTALGNIFLSWEHRIANCLQLAVAHKELGANANCEQLAQYFWMGWEGAVSRAKLIQDAQPLRLFIAHFILSLPK